MNHDDIDSLAVDLHDFFVNVMKVDLNEDSDFKAILSFFYDKLDRFVTHERSYN